MKTIKIISTIIAAIGLLIFFVVFWNYILGRENSEDDLPYSIAGIVYFSALLFMLHYNKNGRYHKFLCWLAFILSAVPTMLLIIALYILSGVRC